MHVKFGKGKDVTLIVGTYFSTLNEDIIIVVGYTLSHSNDKGNVRKTLCLIVTESGCVFGRELRLEFSVVGRKFGCWNEYADDSCDNLGKSNPGMKTRK